MLVAPRPAHQLTLRLYRPCTSCVKRACTERCKYRSELDFVPPPDPPSKPSVTSIPCTTQLTAHPHLPHDPPKLHITNSHSPHPQLHGRQWHLSQLFQVPNCHRR